MSWEKDIKELKKREKLAEKMGGKEKLQRQKNNKRLNVRERIDLLLDKNSFHEIGKIAGKAEYDKEGNLQKFTPSNFVMGRGDINGRKVLSTTLVGDMLNISSFSAGFYMIEVTVGDYKKVSKLVIE